MLDRPDKGATETRARQTAEPSDVEPDHPPPIKRYPGWVRLLLLVGAPGLFWIALVLLILRLTHR